MKSPVVYVGLFLIAFSLYAASLKKENHSKSGITPAAPVEEVVNAEPVTPNAKLLALNAKFSQVFKSKDLPDGLRFERGINDFSGTPEVKIVWSGEDIYRAGDFSIRETLYPVIDRMGKLLRAELANGLRVEIRGFADLDDEVERTAGDYGKSSYAFSYARSEWLAHYLEHHNEIELHDRVQLKGMGAVEKGRKLEVALSYR
jgi:hypothetical protein